MESLIESCKASRKYPKNLVYQNIYEHNKNAYNDQLNQRNMSLFLDSKAESFVNFWERDVGAKGLSTSLSLEDSVSKQLLI